MCCQNGASSGDQQTISLYNWDAFLSLPTRYHPLDTADQTGTQPQHIEIQYSRGSTPKMKVEELDLDDS
jgi:hypothetical protein